jgi:acyl-CoA reductase-like NAD-dependent aldehyde dehydrogenase
MADFKVPLIIRGEIIEDYEVEFHDRSAGGRSFITPNVAKYIKRVVTASPAILQDLYTISFDEILDYMNELGERLNLDTNRHWREAFEVSCYSSNLSRSVLESVYRTSPLAFARDSVREIAETRIGIKFLEGWSRTTLKDGRAIDVRAVGSRSAHIIAGNVPVVAIGTMLRSAITRNDSIIKVPSNDPLTMGAIARTMIDMAPDHPLTRHLTVGYWKGGDEAVEEQIYQPRHIEKLVAWGGFASVKHITKYLQPGIDLITLDPKSSTTLIGKEALIDDATMREVARRTAADLGGWDQEACVNARVMFLESGTDAKGIALANKFGEYLFQAVQDLPKTTSAGPVKFDPALRSELQSIAQQEDFYRIFTDRKQIERTGAIIVSQFDEQVDFPKLLYGRVGNVVPIDRIDDAVNFFSAATQTVGIYPDDLRTRLRDRGALMGGQMFVPVGYAICGTPHAPQDGIEPERRMCRWVVDTRADPAVVPGPWMHEWEIAAYRPAAE